eukprot:11058537-Ditylum_brightwellii.AAC.1
MSQLKHVVQLYHHAHTIAAAAPICSGTYRLNVQKFMHGDTRQILLQVQEPGADINFMCTHAKNIHT